MNFYPKSIPLVFLFLFTFIFVHAQDTLKINKAKRNALKLGVSPIPTKIFFSYEHAFTKHISAGAMLSYGGTKFVGYTCNIFSRYYFSKFNENGWFVEARGSYGHYNPYVYTNDYEPGSNPYHGRSYNGKHRADIDYWNAGVSGGYKVFLQEYGSAFFEFIGGAHYGQATFGTDDNYFERYGISYDLGSDEVQEVFKNSGPGFPLHFIINFGVSF